MQRYLWNLIGLLAIIFISTPAVLISRIKQLTFIDKVDFNFVDQIPFSSIIGQFLSPIIVLLTNVILLLLIDHSAVMERHSSHSQFQSAIFHKAIVYLFLNMLIFPSLSLKNTSIYSLLGGGQHIDTEGFFKEFGMINAAVFFVTLLIQYGCFTGMFYFIRGGELFMTYLSPWIVDYK